MTAKSRIRLSKKAYIAIIGTMLGVSLLVWVLLIAGVFNKKKEKGENESRGSIGVYDIPAVPEGYVLVFRETARYDSSDSGERKLLMKANYDKNGYLLKETSYDENEKIESYFTYSYDEQGRLILRTGYEPGGEEISRRFWKYDQNGNCIELGRIRSDEWEEFYDAEMGPNSTFEEDERIIQSYNYSTCSKYEVLSYSYDEAGRVLELNKYWSSMVHDMGSKGEYWEKYDSEGRIVEKCDGMYTDSYSYNEKGNLIKHYRKYRDKESLVFERLEEEKESRGVEYSMDGDITEETWYDKTGNKVRMKRYNKGKAYLDMKFEYDDFGNEVKDYYDVNGEYICLQAYEYDDKGRVIKEHNYMDSTQTIPNLYDDATENCITMAYDKYGKKITEIAYRPDGTMFNSFIEGRNGYIGELDEYQNRIKTVSYRMREPETVTEYQYKPFVIPIDKLNDADRKALGLE